MWKRAILKAPTAAAPWNRYCYNQSHRRDHRRLLRWPCLFDVEIAPTSSHNNPPSQRHFSIGLAVQDSSSRRIQNNDTKSQKAQKRKRKPQHTTGAIPIVSSKQRKQRERPPSINKMAANMGITLEECSKRLVEECSGTRSIELNKRQQLKPWIMALLIHRYDRGIRDADELNNDSIYYDGGRNFSKNSIQSKNNLILGTSIDLRKVLTPEPNEIDAYIETTAAHLHAKNDTTATSNKNRKTTTQEQRGQISEILRHEKMALLATEARRVLVDREIPFRDMVALKNEAGVRKLSKQDPSIFLSLFSRAFCLSERTKKLSKQNPNQNYGPSSNKKGDESTSCFSHRRFHPPSLKAASHKKKKLRAKKDLEALRKQMGNNSNTKARNSNHKNSPRELQQKLRAMSQRNR